MKEYTMWNKIKTIIVTVLATLGVLFIILMIIPDDEDEAVGSEVQEMHVTQESQDAPEDHEVTDTQEMNEIQEVPQLQEDTEEISAEDQNVGTVTVDIPASEISDKKLKFTTKTLDGKKVDQDVFSQYDITLVLVWGTYSCVAELSKFANFYETVPKNVNLIGIICDVYDGLDNNVEDANEIVSEAGVGFMNLRTSDSIYDITAKMQVVPSAFFVDREGHLIGKMIDGQNYYATISRLNSYFK